QRGAIGCPLYHRATGSADQVLEAPCVDRGGWNDEPVAGRAGLDHRGTQHLAQPEHMVLQGLGCGPGWVVTPERGDEAVGADDLAGAEDQSCEKCPLTSGARSDGSPGSFHLEGAEDPELHR